MRSRANWASPLSFNGEMIRHLEAMLALLKSQSRADNSPDEPEPPSPKPERIPQGETYIESLRRKNRDDVRAGRAISMNALGRELDDELSRRRPPKAPGQQQLLSNGFWQFWR